MSTNLTVRTPATPGTDSRVLRVQKLIEGAIESTPTHIPRVTELAQMVHLSRWRLEHLFKDQTSLTVKQYVKGRVMSKARKLISAGGLTVKEVAFSLGYKNPANFTQDFKDCFGIAPTEYRRSTFP